MLLAMTLACGCSRTPPPGPIVLGHLNPPRSEDEVQGITLAVDALNADPAKHVMSRKIKVIHADAGASPDEGQGQVARLLTIDKVDGLIGGSRWPNAEKLAIAAQSPPTVLVAPSGYAGYQPNSLLFPVGLAPTDQGRTLARYVKENLKGSKVIVLKEGDALLPGLVANSFLESFSGGDRSAAERTIKGGETPDYLKDLGNEKPAAIVLCGSAKQVLAWRAKLPGNVPLLFGGEEADVAVLQSDVDGVKPLEAVVSFHPGDETPAAKEFVRQFSEKYGKPPTLAAALAHDAILVWAEAARRANSLQADKIREQFLKANATFPVLTGSLSFGPSQTPRRATLMIRIGSNRISLIGRYEP